MCIEVHTIGGLPAGARPHGPSGLQVVTPFDKTAAVRTNAALATQRGIPPRVLSFRFLGEVSLGKQGPSAKAYYPMSNVCKLYAKHLKLTARRARLVPWTVRSAAPVIYCGISY
jgi:hypothetical protein